ncbi:TerC family protein [Candidatus Sumerlaeota bacterium]|nr:TerC family protein [Candidatus Sumerlaeota bacterium]
MLWIGFSVFVAGMLALDLGVFHRKSHDVSFKEAVMWVCVWGALAIAFNIGVYIWYDHHKALEFLTGYLLEQSLSVDNMFVFLLLFKYFKVPSAYQHKVLFWGIIGALVLRLAFIFAGTALIAKFEWIIYVFGAFLIFSGIKMWGQKDEEIHPEKNPVLKLLGRIMPIAAYYEKDRFFVRRGGYLNATPMFVVLLIVETTDVLFALDSIPAVMAISKDPFIIYTSNVFAILGLRALFFALAGFMTLFHYLHYGLSAILIFIGLKMIGEDFVHIPVWAALSVLAGILALSVAASLIWPAKEEPKGAVLVGIEPEQSPADPEEN